MQTRSKRLDMRMCFRIQFCLFILFIVTDHNVTYGSKRSTMENLAQLAFQHGVRVKEDASCRLPRAQVVYVNSTDPSKVYMPRGTLLHRCSDQTGCCPHATQTCQPLQMATVELYFFTLSLQINTRHRVRQHQRIEKLLFTNHTLCGCRLRNNNIDTIDEKDNEV